MIKASLTVLLVFCCGWLAGQTIAYPDTLNKRRLTGVAAAQGTIWGGAITGLSVLYYQGEKPSSFRLYNDNGSWLQMDKAGHLFANYYLTSVVYHSYRWAGLNERQALVPGCLVPFLFELNMEVLDGLYSKWGFSWGDVAANTAGCLAFAAQQLAWGEQRFSVRYSWHPSPYGNENPGILGGTFVEKMWEDYNGMTFWLSGNISAFLPRESRFPKWLNIAVGYGVEGQAVDASKHAPCRQFYLSPDIDLTRIQTRSKSLKVLFTLLSILKMPMPAIEFNTTGVVRVYPVYF